MATRAKKVIRGTSLVAPTVDEVITFSGANTHSGVNTFSGNNIHSGQNTFSNDNTFSGDNGFTGTNSFATGKLKKNSEDVPNESETIELAKAEAIKQALIFG